MPPATDDSDLAFWEQEVWDVQPLHPKRGAKAGTKVAIGANRVENTESLDTLKSHPLPPNSALPADAPPLFLPGKQPGDTTLELTITSNTAACLAGHAPGVDGGLRKKLSRGEFPYTARLDLHGYYEGDAWLAIMQFLHDAYAQDHRVVLIICGKGKGFGPLGDMGVIKAQLAGWLRMHPQVLAFHSAIPRDGGAGAVYAYLRRNRFA